MTTDRTATALVPLQSVDFGASAPGLRSYRNHFFLCEILPWIWIEILTLPNGPSNMPKNWNYGFFTPENSKQPIIFRFPIDLAQKIENRSKKI